MKYLGWLAARAHVFIVQLLLLVSHRKWRSLDDLIHRDEYGVWPR